jgi:predicted membrane protein
MAGLVVILVGFGLLLHTLDILPFARLFSRFWLPGLFILIGLLVLSKARGSHGWAGGLFWIGFGLLILLSRSAFFQFNPWSLLGPAIVIWIGLSMLLRGAGEGRLHKRFETRASPGISSKNEDPDDWISATAILGHFERRCTSQQFRGGDITAILGGGKVDLRDADIQSDNATLDISAVMGGIEILVPTSWVVHIKATPVLSGYEDKTHPSKDAGKHLIIKGTSVLAGFEVKN